jgi:hypothetical protein
VAAAVLVGGALVAVVGAAAPPALVPAPTGLGRSEGAPEVLLVWVDAGRTGVKGSNAVAREIQALLGSARVSLASTTASPGEPLLVGGAWIRVVLQSSGTRGFGADAVGGVTCPNSDGQPTVWVVPDVVAAAIGLRLDAVPSWSLIARRQFDHALAVVIAHEIVHLVGHADHSSGLMAPQLDRRDLLAARPPLPPDARVRVLAGLDELSRAPRLVRAGDEPSPRRAASR